MDFNYILLWLVFAYSLLSLFQLLRFMRKGNLLWIVKNASVLGISLLLLKIMPDLAGYIGGILWGVFVLLPLLGFRLINKLGLRHCYFSARIVSLGLWLLHPDPGLILSSVLFKGRLLASHGRKELAVNYLKSFTGRTGSFYLLCTVSILQIEQKWGELARWFKGIQADSTLLPYYCLALGETGLIPELVKISQVHYALFAKLNYFAKSTMRLYIAAFGGDADEVECLLNSALSDYSREQKTYWRAVALQAKAQDREARVLLEGLKQGKDRLLADAAARRLSLPAQERTPVLSQEVLSAITAGKEEYYKEEKYSFLKKIKRRTAFITLALIGINIIVFAAECLLGGSTDEMTLYKMGALYTMGFAAGDWWRIITAQFLHYGWLHLAMNMAGLYVLGPYVESFVGHLKYALIYFLSGTGALICFLAIAMFDKTYDFLVGASAGIMGIVGALFAVLLKASLVYRTKVMRNQLFILSFFIGLQIVFDLSTPEVSFWGHFFGLVIGFFCTWILLLVKKKA